MKNTITMLQNKLNTLQAKQLNAFRNGNFTAVNRYTKEIVKIKIMLDEIQN